MTDVKQARGHSRKLKIGVGGQPVVSILLALRADSTLICCKTVVCLIPHQQSWNSDVELQPTISQGKVTAAQNTDLTLAESVRQPVAQGNGVASKQAFTITSTRSKKDANSFPAFHSKNAPVKVSVTGEWALKECQVVNYIFIQSSSNV